MLRGFATILAPAGMICCGLAVFWWLQAQSAPPTRTAVSPQPPLVETIEFDPGDGQFEIRVSGNVVPSREVSISAQVTGTVLTKSDQLQSGRFVTENTPLLRIDPASYELDVQAAANQWQQVQEDLRRLDVEAAGMEQLAEVAQEQRKLAERELERVRGLFADNAVAETQLDEVQRLALDANQVLLRLRNSLDLVPVRRRRLESELQLADVRRQTAQLNLERTRVAAPFDGIITTDAVELGDYVQPGDVLLAVEETDSIEVVCNLRTEDLYWLWNSQASGTAATAAGENAHQAAFELPQLPAVVSYELAGRNFEWPGILARYEGQGVDRGTRTVPCRVVVANPKQAADSDGPPALMRGMYVTVTFAVSPRTRLWRVPNRVLQPNGQLWTFEQGALRIHQVAAARVVSDGVLIRAADADFQIGDRVVVTQLPAAFDGMRVRETSAAEGSP